jgi:hypothetical protein
VFADANDPSRVYYLPTTVSLTNRPSGEPNFGVQLSGYTSRAPATRVAAVTLTYHLQVVASDIAEVEAFLKKSVNQNLALYPLPSFEYQMSLGLGGKAARRVVLATGSSTVDASHSLDFDLGSLALADFVDMFGSDNQESGLLLDIIVPNVVDDAAEVVISSATLISHLRAVGKWNASTDIELLAEEVLDSISVDRIFVPAFREWLLTVLPPPELTVSPSDIHAEWKLDSDSVQNKIGHDSVTLRLTDSQAHNRHIYGAFGFLNFCSTYSSHFVDLDSGTPGCPQQKIVHPK